jgi:4-hydroxybenzoate polyprenyltransferase
MLRSILHTEAFEDFEHSKAYKKVSQVGSQQRTEYSCILQARQNIYSVVNSFQRLLYNLHTVYLFTHDQFFDVIAPCTTFAICAALSSTLDLPSIETSTILQRAPLVVLWLWFMVLQFCLHNQRHPDSVDEDALNKPWRPLPAGRISITATNQLLLANYAVIIAMSYYTNTTLIWAGYTLLVITYNDLRGGDIHGLCRNALNAGGYFCFFSSAIQVAIGPYHQLSSRSYLWTGLLCFALFTTFHSQDFRDVVGDAARGRKTILSALGNGPARVFLVAMGALWSVVIPLWFRVGWVGMLAPGLLGVAVAVMTLMGWGGRNVKLDGKMYKVWCLWMVSLTPMPLVASFAQSVSA